MANLLAGAALVLALFALGRRLAGWRVGLVAACLAAFDPSLIAHSRYLTTDVPVTLGIVLTLAQLVRAVEAPSRRATALLLLAATATMLVKFSGLILLLVLPLTAWLLGRRRKLPWSARRLTLLLLASLLVAVPVLYRGSVRRPNADPRVPEILTLRNRLALDRAALAVQPPIVRWAVRTTEPGTRFRSALDATLAQPTPGYWFVRGVSAVVSHTLWGQRSYLLGRTSEHGWRWYFPVVFLVKTPLPTFALLLLALATLGRLALGRRPFPRLVVVVGVPLVIYVVGTFASRLNLGLRHLLPIYPLLFLLIGWAVVQRPLLGRWCHRLVVSAALMLLPIGTLAVHPFEIASFSQLVGGLPSGHRYLLDSNLDWGQDLLRLQRELRRRSSDRVALAYFGTADPETYGVHWVPLPEQSSPNLPRYAAVSLTLLIGEWPRYAWVTAHPFVGRAGASIALFDLTR